MTLMRRSRDVWDPLDFVRDLQNEMGRFLNTSFPRKDGEKFFWQHGFEPDIDVREEGEHYLVKADLPGIKTEEIEISVNGNLLTLKGERKRESETKTKDYFYSERFHGGFTRTVALPTDVEADKAKASYQDGVLELTLPKVESAKPKHIRVEIK